MTSRGRGIEEIVILYDYVKMFFCAAEVGMKFMLAFREWKWSTSGPEDFMVALKGYQLVPLF